MEPFAPKVVHVRVDAEERTSRNLQTEFLLQLAAESVPWMLPELDFPSRELPFAGEGAGFRTTDDEDPVSRCEKGNRDKPRFVHGSGETTAEP